MAVGKVAKAVEWIAKVVHQERNAGQMKDRYAHKRKKQLKKGCNLGERYMREVAPYLHLFPKKVRKELKKISEEFDKVD